MNEFKCVGYSIVSVQDVLEKCTTSWEDSNSITYISMYRTVRVDMLLQVDIY